MKEAQQGAATMPDPQAFLKQIEESIRIEEETLGKEVSPAAGSGKFLLERRRALAAVTEWIAELSATDQEAPACYAAGARQRCSVEIRREWLGTEAAEDDVLIAPRWCQQVHEAEPARIVEDHARTRIEIEHHVIVKVQLLP